MPELLRFWAMIVSGSLAIVFIILSLAASVWYLWRNEVRKAYFVSASLMALAIMSVVLAIVVWDPTRSSAALVVLTMGLLGLVLYVAVGYRGAELALKGLRLFWRVLEALIRRLTGHKR